jgi:hypothetical protein
MARVDDTGVEHSRRLADAQPEAVVLGQSDEHL